MIHTVYVSSHDRWAALHVAGVLSSAGFQIASTWHHEGFSRTASLSEEERQHKAAYNADAIASADALVLIAAPDMVPGGKFVEAGIAIGAGKPIAVLGRRENLLMWHPRIHAFDTPGEIVSHLARLKS